VPAGSSVYSASPWPCFPGENMICNGSTAAGQHAGDLHATIRQDVSKPSMSGYSCNSLEISVAGSVRSGADLTTQGAIHPRNNAVFLHDRRAGAETVRRCLGTIAKAIDQFVRP